MYWLVNNNEIVEFYRNLPKSNKQISWLDKLSDEKLRVLWYYKVIWNSEPLKDWQTYWKTTYNIWEEYIEEVKEIIDEELEDYKAMKIEEQSKRTQNIILSEYNEIYQLNINRELWRLQDEFNRNWTTNQTRLEELKAIDMWIEEQRALYQTRKLEINACATQEEVFNYVQNLSVNTEELWV